MIAFSGPARPATMADYAAAARAVGTSVPMVQALAQVESGGHGGYLPDGSGRPWALEEAEHFHALTGGVYDATHPNISSPVWNPKLYLGGAAEYTRISEAYALNPSAALRSTSWGLFQIMGSNWQPCGFSTLDDFMAAMQAGEGEHLTAFANLVKANKWDAYLRRGDLAGFSEHWNGPGYRANGYLQKLQAALAAAEAAADGTLTIGAAGPLVRALQIALVAHLGINISVDGLFGPATQVAVRRFQATHALSPDGIVGPETRAGLGLSGASA